MHLWLESQQTSLTFHSIQSARGDESAGAYRIGDGAHPSRPPPAREDPEPRSPPAITRGAVENRRRVDGRTAERMETRRYIASGMADKDRKECNWGLGNAWKRRREAWGEV